MVHRCKVWKFLVPPHLFIDILVSDMFFIISSNGTIMVTSGIIFSFRTHPFSSRNIWIRYICGHCLCLHTFKPNVNFQEVSVFHWFPCSGPSRAFSCLPWRPPRNINTDRPDFEFRYHNLMTFIYGQKFCRWQTILPHEFLRTNIRN
jgi:hypothetical protein